LKSPSLIKILTICQPLGRGGGVPLGQMLAGRPGPVAPGGRDAVAGGDSLGLATWRRLQWLSLAIARGQAMIVARSLRWQLGRRQWQRQLVLLGQPI